MPTIALRPAQEDDLLLLRRIYASTRQQELATAGWSDAQREWFVGMQFDLQVRAFAQAHPEANWQVVVCDDQPVGRLIVDRSAISVRLVDIALLPDYRNAGIGSEMLRRLQDEATLAGKPIVLHVASSNPARTLYQRLGFFVSAWDDVYLEMHWRPGGDAATQSAP